MTALLQFFRHFLGKGYEFLFSLFSFPGSAALPGVCDKGQFGCFLTICFLGFSFLQSVGHLRFAPNGAATI